MEETGCMSLDFLKLDDVLCTGGVPSLGFIFQCLSHKPDLCRTLDVYGTFSTITS